MYIILQLGKKKPNKQIIASIQHNRLKRQSTKFSIFPLRLNPTICVVELDVSGWSQILIIQIDRNTLEPICPRPLYMQIVSCIEYHLPLLKFTFGVNILELVIKVVY